MVAYNNPRNSAPIRLKMRLTLGTIGKDFRGFSQFDRARRGDPCRRFVVSAWGSVCNNVLAPGDLVDLPSGNAAINGIPVEVTPV